MSSLVSKSRSRLVADCTEMSEYACVPRAGKGFIVCGNSKLQYLVSI